MSTRYFDGVAYDLVAGAPDLDGDADCSDYLQAGDVVVRASGLAIRCNGSVNRADREFAGVVVVEGLNNRDELDVVGKQKPKWGTLAVAVYRAAKQPLKQGSKSMEVISKTRALVVKHEDLLFKIAFLLVLDHLVFKGEMRNKLKAFAEKLFNRVMASLD